MATRDVHVKRMFESIAFSYDFQNSFLSLGQDIAWRRAFARSVQVPRGGVVLDLATGTAELAMAICAYHPGVRLMGLDFSPGMLAIGRRKVLSSGLAKRITLSLGDARRLPFRTDSVDGVTMAFGIRNIEERRDVLLEIWRVLKQGARLWIMEFDCPDQPLIGRLYRFYFDHIMPPLGNWLSRTDYAYSYLAKSVHGFPSEEEFVQEIKDAGFTPLGVRRLSLGIAKMYSGVKKAVD
ncbi:MAG: bifunctional demethylmenaquinone methyltransferase/2-methoxy-6-polyprenyl-1,4-benzoquinol methylase UbiE [Desulfobacterota bacterium]|nr:bifunctional demethylmenaquinone methyltransferase/2-methoxy-6-polyprenyl-1,4-benzoquinol methylase UbiE [Thermodesulfobacteriota bacterium]